MNAPANLFAKRFDPEPLRTDANVGSAIGREIAASNLGLGGWVNIPLVNSTGESDDLDLRFSQGPKETTYAVQLPSAMAIVEWIRSQDFIVQHARIAVLLNRDLLRPHVDMHHSVRLLVQLNDHELDFRHVFGIYCVALKAGELWGVDGSICHGAANLADSHDRVVLIIDCNADHAPAWYSETWNIPRTRVIPRKRWDKNSRFEYRRRAAALAAEQGALASEKQWLLVPYEYDIEAHAMYSELITFCEDMASAREASPGGTYWESRAQYWRAHNCVCV